MIILFDTETTGLLKPEANDLEAQPRIIEFFATKLTSDFEHKGDIHFYAKPPLPIEPIITKITGIRQETLDKAEPFGNAVEELTDFFMGVSTLVAHNLAFDRTMLVNELRHIEREFVFPYPPRQICTVEASMHIQQRRMPLKNLHKYLLGHEHTDQHSAKGDVYALVRVFHQLVERGMIKI